MDRWTLLALALSTALYWGCTTKRLLQRRRPRRPRISSTWSAPAIVQQGARCARRR